MITRTLNLKNRLFSSALLISLLPIPALAAGYNNASQWNQIGWKPQYTININGTSQTITPTGKGITVGVIDTGATPQWIGNVAGSINLGTCQITGCTSSADDQGHGTFVASEIASNLTSTGMTGLANGAKILAVKVLSADGSGNSNDVVKGINYAANNGAQVLNLSLGPSGTAAQQAAFYSSIASAVNYAASKGVFVVFAGGNANQALAAGSNISGFTDDAIKHMVFVGSVNSANAKSSFSNTAGTAGFVSNTGKFYAYKDMWLMTNGESLWGASNYHTAQYGYSYLTQMSGTSMAAPEVAASLALLESQWAILKTNGTALQVLTSTAKDLGTAGNDATFGAGLTNLTQAMNPYGALTVKKANGQSVALSSVNGSLVLGGAFGAVSNGKLSTALQTALANYTTFDGFTRNYVVNLSKLVTGTAASSTVANSVTAPKTTTSGAKFADGSSLAFGSSETVKYDLSRPSSTASDAPFFMSFTDASGTTVAAGSGFPASASFAGALWGAENPSANQVYELAASSTLSNIAQGGAFAAYGTPISKNTRIAFSLSQTKYDDALTSASGSAPSATSFNTGISELLTDKLRGGLTLSLLDQTNGMLDSIYSGNGVSLGNNHQSVSIGATSTYALSDKQDLVFDAAIVRTDGASISGGLITSVTPTYSRSMGASYVQRDAVKSGDNFSLSVRAPLKVVSGAAFMDTSSVDGNGLPVTTSQKIGLKPSGNEVDLSFGYQAPVSEEGASWGLALEARHDANNIAGANDATAMLRSKLTF